MGEQRVAIADDDRPQCFVVMPISDPDEYDVGHFKHVFEDIFVPACAIAGFRAFRADQVQETNLIHLDVLQRLVDSPMVLCDLSSRNPNVLFELGLRQAFDKPTTLVQEVGTPKIFDIVPLRLTEYRRACTYHEVLEDQQRIALAIKTTQEATKASTGVNSIVKILSLTRPATLPELQKANQDPALQIIRAELNALRSDLRRLLPQRPASDDAVPNEAAQLVARLSLALARYDVRLQSAESRSAREDAHADELATLERLVAREMMRYEERNGHIPEFFRLQYLGLRTRHNDLLEGVTREDDPMNAG
jgi:hypothetical protein